MWCDVCVVARVFVLYVVARVLCMVAMVLLFVSVFCAVTMVLLCSCLGILCGHRGVAIGLLGCSMFEGVSNISVCNTVCKQYNIKSSNSFFYINKTARCDTCGPAFSSSVLFYKCACDFH